MPDRADEVLYKLRAIVLAVRSDGLLKANEELTGQPIHPEDRIKLFTRYAGI